MSRLLGGVSEHRRLVRFSFGDLHCFLHWSHKGELDRYGRSIVVAIIVHQNGEQARRPDEDKSEAQHGRYHRFAVQGKHLPDADGQQVQSFREANDSKWRLERD